MRLFSVLAAAALLLAGCAVASNPNTEIAAAQSGYIAAASAESVWISSGKATPAQIAAVEKYRLPAYNALEPMVQAAESGGSATTAAEQEVLAAAVAAYTNYEISQNILKGS